MPKAVKYVEFNDGGEWSFALVTGEESPENYNLLVKDANAGGWSVQNNVPQGTASGHWREPQD